MVLPGDLDEGKMRLSNSDNNPGAQKVITSVLEVIAAPAP
jgi:hypothetical protein